MPRRSPDISGRKFGRLTAIRLVENNKFNHTQWECLCDPKHGGCGSIVIVATANLKNGNTRSCGCLRKDANMNSHTTHGFSSYPEYSVWKGMLSRCYNEKNNSYPEYGGCGITVCDEWKESFEAFYRDMGPRPSQDHSIDRKENDKGYSKENCRWATWEEQASNRRNNLFYDYNGVKRTLAAWCRELSLNYPTVYARLQSGMPFEKAVEFEKK